MSTGQILDAFIGVKNQLSKAEARIAELEEALRPFAGLAKELPTGPDWELDERPVWSFNNAVITLGEMRRVKRVLDAD